MDDLVKRVQRLEAELKKVKRSRMIWLCLAGGMLLVAFQAPSSDPKVLKVVEAEEFRLVDEEGRLRGEWKTNRADPFTRFSIWDWEGKGCEEVVRIQSHEGGGEIKLQGGKDHGMVRLSTEDRGGHLQLQTVRTSSNGGILYWPMARFDALPDHGRIEVFKVKFEETPEGGLTVSPEPIFFTTPEPK